MEIRNSIILLFLLTSLECFAAKQPKPILDLHVDVTAYTPTREETDDTPETMACGYRSKPGYIAISQDLFRAGKLCGKMAYICGKGWFKVGDTMNIRHTKMADILVLTKREAHEIGMKPGRLLIYDKLNNAKATFIPSVCITDRKDSRMRKSSSTGRVRRVLPDVQTRGSRKRIHNTTIQRTNINTTRTQYDSTYILLLCS